MGFLGSTNAPQTVTSNTYGGYTSGNGYGYGYTNTAYYSPSSSSGTNGYSYAAPSYGIPYSYSNDQTVYNTAGYRGANNLPPVQQYTTTVTPQRTSVVNTQPYYASTLPNYVGGQPYYDSQGQQIGTYGYNPNAPRISSTLASATLTPPTTTTTNGFGSYSGVTAQPLYTSDGTYGTGTPTSTYPYSSTPYATTASPLYTNTGTNGQYGTSGGYETTPFLYTTSYAPYSTTAAYRRRSVPQKQK